MDPGLHSADFRSVLVCLSKHSFNDLSFHNLTVLYSTSSDGVLIKSLSRVSWTARAARLLTRVRHLGTVWWIRASLWGLTSPRKPCYYTSPSWYILLHGHCEHACLLTLYWGHPSDLTSLLKFVLVPIIEACLLVSML